MPTPTYIPLGTIELTSTDSEIVFSSIPATYRDLIVVANFTASNSDIEVRMRLNADSGSNYSWVFMGGRSAGTQSSSSASATQIRFSFVNTGANRNAVIAQILDASATDKHKAALVRFNSAADNLVYAVAGRWANTAAVTSVSILPETGNFAIGSTFSLFGIA